MVLFFFLIFQVKSMTYQYIPTTKQPPVMKSMTSLAYYSDANSLVVFGGFDGVDYFNDVNLFKLTTSR